MDGREPDMVLTCYTFYSAWRDARAQGRQFNSCTCRQQPAEAQLNQQHQHKVLASIRRQLEPAGWVFRIGVSWASA
jgi:hypothetical protein